MASLIFLFHRGTLNFSVCWCTNNWYQAL